MSHIAASRTHASAGVNAARDRYVRRRAASWADIDRMLSDEVAYIPLDVTQFYFLRGSNVENYVNAASTNGYPDLAVISVKNGGT